MKKWSMKRCRRRVWLVACTMLAFAAQARGGNPDGDLSIEIITAHNLIVDSNVESPSTYAPRSAYLGARYCNNGTDPLTNVWAYIGDYAAGTPGLYPSRAHPPLVGPLPGGEFALWHEGGAMGTRDATRYLGTLEPGKCVTVYWLVSYPNLDENGDAVWGPSIKPDDDLWLQFDVWGTAQDGAAYLEADDTRTLTMRNEISAMANKIYPNGANKVPQEYKDLLNQYVPTWTNTLLDGTPGTILRTEGIWYDLGNVGDGFDNDGDLVPDRNAWLQPIGDAALFDPSCFRLVRTYAMVVVKLNDGTEQVLIVEDELYFTQIPANNVGAVGYVMYEFIVLGAGCVSTVTPYQEVASGFDNEKFNGDFGATGPNLTSGTSLVAIAKSADPILTRPGSNVAYTVSFTNSGPDAAGMPELNMPLVVQDSIPTGTVYVAGSAAPNNVLPGGVTAYRIYYSTNHGATWLLSEPAVAANVTDLQWWLSDPLPPGGTGIVRFTVTIDNPWPFPEPVVPNTAGLSFGNTAPFLWADAETFLLGNNALGDTVWLDDGTGGGMLGNQLRDGAEPGRTGVTVRLYYDANANGAIDLGDTLFAVTNSGTAGYYTFTNLPDGYFLAEVDIFDTDVPFGYTPTTPTLYSIPLDPARTNVNPVVDWTADFGFAPALTLTKTLASTNAFREGQLATYFLTVSNSLPGDGSGDGSPATFYSWAESGFNEKNDEWFTATNVWIPPGPDGRYASNNFAAASKLMIVSNFHFDAQMGAVAGVSLVLPIVVIPPMGDDDSLTVDVTTGVPATTRYNQTFLVTNNVTGVWTIPMTGTYAWSWADFSTNCTVTLTARKNAGGATAGWMLLDAIGFKIETDATVGESSPTTTLNPVPLADRYDADLFQFVGAEPPITSIGTNGAPPDSEGNLYWDNIGPVYPGGTSTVAVTFKLLEPPNNTNATVTNICWTTNAMFTSGLPANDQTAQVVNVLLPAATVGDFVWRDLDGDGVQDAGEPGVPNVAVSITPPAGIDLGRGAGLAITNWTDDDGYYLFESIPTTGIYTVRVVTATLPGGTGVNTYDERGAYDSTAAIYLNVYTNGTNNLHLTTDFGYTLQSTIEGTIWHDADGGQEAFREDGENWMTNVTVYLCASPSPCGPGASIATNVTTTNGYFRFTGNFNGTYTVYVATNSGTLAAGDWSPSWDTDGTNTANYSAVTVPSGGSGRVDFSYVRAGAYRIGDTLFYDWDGDGTQDTNETGIADVTVWLHEDANGNGVVDAGTDALIGTTLTATNGYYVFTNRYPGTYLVMVDRDDPDLPSDYVVTADPYGAMDARSVVTIVNADDFDQDFGFQPYGSGTIGDTVWYDRDANGVQGGALEVGISNVCVGLFADYDGDDVYELVRMTQTSTNGLYLFTGLPDGDYRVQVDINDTNLPCGYYGNIFFPTTPTSFDTTLAGNAYLDADFGFASFASIGDTVFWDVNRTGTQDTGEPGVPGVELELYLDENANGIADAGDVYLTNTFTDAEGKYLFSRLLPGNYVVVVVADTGPLAGADQTADPNSDGLTCDDPELVVPCDDQYGQYLAAFQNFTGADFGYAPRGVIGDTLWVDANNNGVRDDGELGIPYVSVILYSNGVAIATNETDADGYYGFSGLVDFANYGVGVDTGDADFPAGLVSTWTADGTFDDYTTNIVMSGGAVTSIGGYPCTDCDLNVDFGYRYAGSNSLSGTIGLDATPYDGLMNGLNPSGPGAGESPYAGVPVTLYLWDDDGDGIIEAGETTQIGTETTDANGDYAFTGLPNGDGNDRYVVASPAPESSLTLTTTNGSIAGVTVFTTTDVQGYAVSARLAVDVAPAITNMDFAYSTTTLYDYGDLPDSYDTLLADGARHVVPLTPNLYLGAGVDTEQNGVPSVGADGDDLAGTDDEDGVLQITNSIWQVGTEGGSVEVTVGAGSGWLLGYIDFNGDGDFVDVGEMVCSLAVSNTGGNGAGVYTNAFTVPAGTFSTTSSTPLYARFRLYPEQPLFPALAFAGTADNGEVEDYLWHLAGVGDTVWYDLDGDGMQDAGEPPIVGVRVFVDLNDDGIWQTTEPSATTDADGLYGIGGLVPGTYSVVVDTDTLVAGVTQTYDLDGLATPHKASVEITALDQFVSTVDFGYAPPATLGDWIWFDADRDGIQDSTETNGIPLIPVALLDTNGNVVAETAADLEGHYLFAHVPTGTYLVRFDLTSLTTNETLSSSKVGDDDVVDNDWISGNATDYAWTAPVVLSAGETNSRVDLGIATRTPTRAALAEVWGEWVDGAARVVWRTDSEFGTAGFFVYRVDPETGAETRLNDRLVFSAFNEGGATYALAEPAAGEGEAGAYRLVEVELSGTTLDLGTRQVRFDAPVAPAAVSRSALTVKPAVKSVRPKGLTGPSPVLKVQVAREGLYGLAWQAVADGMGLSLAEVQALAEAGGLRISRQGQPVPVLADAARERLLFHARQPERTWYAHADAYLISAGEGVAMARREPGAASGTSVFPTKLHFEENLFLVNLNRMPDDFYFWIPVMSGAGEMSVNPVPLDLSGYAGGDVALKVRLVGSSSSANYPDHLARFAFNGVEVGSVAFDGQDVAEAELTVPASAVAAEQNVLTIEGVQPEGYAQSFFFVDWVEATFDRALAPWPIPATFGPAGASAVSAQAFDEPLAVAVDASGNPAWLADENGELPAKAWAVADPSERFAVAEADAVPLLVPEAAAADAGFLSAANQIDYLVIASRDLASAAQELVDYRAGQGLRAGLATFEDACDLLTGGVRTPEAVPALLRYAAATWAVAPRMVVLAGNGHYDYQGITYAEPNHLPPLMIQMPAGVCASDGLLADTGGDDLPDLAIGRLPALTAAELTAMIAKIKAYEAGFGSEWQNQIVLAADNPDAAGAFTAANGRLADLVQAPYSVAERIELESMDVGTARANLRTRFNSGVGFVNYVGHGDIKYVSKEILPDQSVTNLLRDTDVAALTNAARPSVVATLTCLAARYEVPNLASLGERLMRSSAGGAVAVIGPSGLSQNAPALEMGEAFYHAIFRDGAGELGPAFLKARRSLPASLFTKDTIAVYNLLGDPALKIAGNEPADDPLTPAQISLSNLMQTFDGTPRAVSAATVPAGLAVRISYGGHLQAPTAAGTYAVVASAATVGYEGFATGTLVVAKAAASVALGDLAQTYDGAPKSATATTQPAGLAIEWTYAGVAEPPTAAGEYEVVATVADVNYAGAVTGLLRIAKAPVAVALNELTRIFDGAPQGVAAQSDPEGLDIQLTYDGSSAPPVAAGRYEVVAAVADENHSGGASGTLEIARRPATVALGSLLQPCTGGKVHATATTDPPNLAVDFTYDGFSSAPTTVGRYAVVATVGDPNHAGSATGTLVVTKGTASVSLGNLLQIYDGRPKAASAATAPAGLGVDVTYDGSRFPPTEPGRYAIEATIEDANFTGAASGTLTIWKLVDSFEIWLETRNLNPADVRFAEGADEDEDFRTTWDEYIADTDPENPGDTFAVAGRIENGALHFEFPASSNRFYHTSWNTPPICSVRDGCAIWGGAARVRSPPTCPASGTEPSR